MAPIKVPFFSVKRNVVFTAIFYTFFWGSAFPLVKLCMGAFGIGDADNMSKCLLAGVRFAVSGVFTLLWCALTDKSGLKLQNKKQCVTVLGYGLLATSLQYAFTYIGLSRIDGSKGAIFDQLCVFVIVLLGGLFFKSDRLTLFKVLGCVLGFAGVLVINIDGLGFDFSIGGEGVMLVAVACQSAAYFVAKSCAGDISAPKLVGYGQCVGGILLTAFALIRGGRMTLAKPLTAVWTLLALIFISAVAYVLSLMPLKYFPASEISSFNLLITVFGVVMSAAVLGDNIFKWNYGVSLLLIILGILLINRTEKEKKS